MNKFKDKKIFIIGIGGISLSALARLLKSQGAIVRGSDEHSSEVTQALKADGVKVFIGHNKNNVHGSDIVVYTSAISFDNPEYKEAIRSNIQIMSRAQLLGEIASCYKSVIAVCGSHGKTTTTSIISNIFHGSNTIADAHIGGISVNHKSNVVIREGASIFITEACEYKDNYLTLRPMVEVVLNIGLDHVDFFSDIDEIKRSFLSFSNNVSMGGTLIINYDCKNCDFIRKETSTEKTIITFSIHNKNANYYLSNIKKNCIGYTFDVNGAASIKGCRLNISGKHNLYNALASIVVALMYGIDTNCIKNGLATFKGVSRRYEHIGEINGAKVISDYAHHPDEIKKVISAAREECVGKVYAVFQPHTYSRTKHLWADFITSLIKADNVVLYPIYPAREKSMMGVTSKRLAYDIRQLGKPCYYADDLLLLRTYLSYFVKKEDLVLILGAGDIDRFRNYI